MSGTAPPAATAHSSAARSAKHSGSLRTSATQGRHPHRPRRLDPSPQPSRHRTANAAHYPAHPATAPAPLGATSASPPSRLVRRVRPAIWICTRRITCRADPDPHPCPGAAPAAPRTRRTAAPPPTRPPSPSSPPCRAASNSAGWIPKPSPPAPSGSTTSVNTSRRPATPPAAPGTAARSRSPASASPCVQPRYIAPAPRRPAAIPPSPASGSALRRQRPPRVARRLTAVPAIGVGAGLGAGVDGYLAAAVVVRRRPP